MAAEVAKMRRSECPEVAPGDRKVSRVEWPRLARSQPQVPVQAGGDRRLLHRPCGQRRIPALGAYPGMNLANRAQRAAPDPLASFPDARIGMALVSHLRGHTRLFSNAGHLPRLPEIVRERLFTIDMLAGTHGHRGYIGMEMIRRRAE